MADRDGFTLLGAGAMNSPRYSPAGLLISRGRVRVAIDGGPGAEPTDSLAAWLVTDEHAELIREPSGPKCAGLPDVLCQWK